MGLWIEIKEKATCLDNFCVAKTVLEYIMSILGTRIEQIEVHVEKLGKLISDDSYTLTEDGYTFTVERVEITVYNIGFDIIECSLEGCEGYVVASVLLEGDDVVMKEIAKKIAKDMGIDKYLKCE
jgi:hypothetical protein